MTKILNGNKLSDKAHQSIKAEVGQLKVQYDRVPGLGVILVGNNPASKSYVKRKSKVAKKECGFITKDIILEEESSEEDLEDAIREFNTDSEIDGILLQLPLPRHLNANKFIDLISPKKDADGLHPHNQGLMLRGDAKQRPCTPLGSLTLIDLAFSEFDIEQDDFSFDDLNKADLSGKSAVIIGRSILVGKPLHSLLLERNCTVTQCHSRTKNIENICKQADIVIAAVGVPKLVKADWIKEGAVVIDVGINRTEEGKLVGDVDYNQVKEKVSAITPVPGGVGPMTVAMLMKNTLACFKTRMKHV